MRPQAPHLRLGHSSEKRAHRWLTSKGLRPVTKNYRCRHGEIDLVMLDDDCLVFIEVRYRRDHLYGGALASVDANKQQRILRTAAYFLQQHTEHRQRPVRFDVLALGPGTTDQDILWLKQAFVASEY